MKNRNFCTILTCSFFLMTIACGGSRKSQNPGDFDLSWAGKWKGRALIVNSLNPPKEMELSIEFASTKVNAFLSDPTENLRHLPIRELVFEENTILFKASYETQRGLRRNVVFRGLRIGPYLKIEFSGSEGGRAFRGKWQAKHSRSPAVRHTTQPSDTTSTTS